MNASYSIADSHWTLGRAGGALRPDERLIVQVAEGHHTIEVERDGYERFTTELDVRPGETTPVNINLRRR